MNSNVTQTALSIQGKGNVFLNRTASLLKKLDAVDSNADLDQHVQQFAETIAQKVNQRIAGNTIEDTVAHSSSLLQDNDFDVLLTDLALLLNDESFDVREVIKSETAKLNEAEANTCRRIAQRKRREREKNAKQQLNLSPLKINAKPNARVLLPKEGRKTVEQAFPHLLEDTPRNRAVLKEAGIQINEKRRGRGRPPRNPPTIEVLPVPPSQLIQGTNHVCYLQPIRPVSSVSIKPEVTCTRKTQTSKNMLQNVSGQNFTGGRAKFIPIAPRPNDNNAKKIPTPTNVLQNVWNQNFTAVEAKCRSIAFRPSGNDARNQAVSKTTQMSLPVLPTLVQDNQSLNSLINTCNRFIHDNTKTSVNTIANPSPSQIPINMCTPTTSINACQTVIAVPVSHTTQSVITNSCNNTQSAITNSCNDSAISTVSLQQHLQTKSVTSFVSFPQPNSPQMPPSGDKENTPPQMDVIFTPAKRPCSDDSSTGYECDTKISPTIVRSAEATRHTLGYSPDEIIGTPANIQVPHETSDAAKSERNVHINLHDGNLSQDVFQYKYVRNVSNSIDKDYSLFYSKIDKKQDPVKFEIRIMNDIECDANADQSNYRNCRFIRKRNPEDIVCPPECQCHKDDASESNSSMGSAMASPASLSPCPSPHKEKRRVVPTLLTTDLTDTVALDAAGEECVDKKRVPGAVEMCRSVKKVNTLAAIRKNARYVLDRRGIRIPKLSSVNGGKRKMRRKRHNNCIK